MEKLRIFVDFAASPDVLAVLREGAKGHQLVFPEKPASSVLAKAERDPQFATVNVAFGQPDPVAIAEASQLKWIHVSSSGITRYDTPEFRALMAQRNIVVTNSASVYNEACAAHALSSCLVPNAPWRNGADRGLRRDWETAGRTAASIRHESHRLSSESARR